MSLCTSDDSEWEDVSAGDYEISSFTQCIQNCSCDSTPTLSISPLKMMMQVCNGKVIYQNRHSVI